MWNKSKLYFNGLEEFLKLIQIVCSRTMMKHNFGSEFSPSAYTDPASLNICKDTSNQAYLPVGIPVHEIQKYMILQQLL